MPEMAFKVVEDVMLVVHSGQPPLKDDWNRYVQEHVKAKAEGRKLSILVFTAGGGPDSTQRAALRQAIDGSPETAVVSRSVLVRGIVTAFNWLGWSAMRAFSPTELDQALRFVRTKLPAERLLAEIKLLEQRLSSRVDLSANP